MADVFISYARTDASLASMIASILKMAGYEVWWDSKLLPHHAFAESIEQEVRSARAVLVVWSEHAVSSQWVRAEADLARSQSKLVQIAIDQCAIPLPFNQYQTADLRRWTGDASDLQWMKVLASIAQLTSKPASANPSARDGAKRSNSWRRLVERCSPSFFIVAALAIALVAGTAIGGVWLVSKALLPAARGARIAVKPFETIGQTPTLHDFAASLSEGLQDALNQDQLQTLSRSDAETLQGADLQAKLKALDVGLLLSGTVQAAGDALTVRMNLEDPREHATLWSADIPGRAVQPEALQARVGARTVAVLNCSAQALNRKNGIADADVLALFLHACDLAEISHHGSSDDKLGFAMLDAMREVARRAPNFAAGHSILAKHAAFLVDDLPGQAATLRQEADREAHRALQIDPKDPDGFVALGLLVPHMDFGQREQFFRQALAVDPSWPHANGFLGNVMTDVGRLDEASMLYQRAASVNPLSPDWSDMAAKGLIWAGNSKQADADLAHFSQLWPNDAQVWVNQNNSLIAQHRWADALKHLDEADPSFATELPIKRWRAELTALNAHDAAALEGARQHDLLLATTNPEGAIASLAMLGFVEDAFTLAQRYSPDDSDIPGFLFSPLTTALRRDRRFMVLANKFRLPHYWISTGHWPDFCSDRDLPYNCKEEAAKVHQQFGY